MRRYIAALTRTPQSVPLKGQVRNSAGGHAWELDRWARARRFLVLGAEGGTYYAGESTVVARSVECLRDCLYADGVRLVRLIEEVSTAGLAPKNDPALLALALCMKQGDLPTRAAARTVLPNVARTGTHLFRLAEAVQAFGGWGRGTRRAFADWYLRKDPQRLALQLVKYQQREGWTHRDVLRLCKPAGHQRGGELDRLLGWAAGREVPLSPDDATRLIWACRKAGKTRRVSAMVRLIEQHQLPREAVPSELVSMARVQEALLHSGPHGMPLGALLRNLGNLSAAGVLTPLSEAERFVCRRLVDPKALAGARIHPLQVLVAHQVYAAGGGVRSRKQWKANRRVIDALDEAFRRAFGSVPSSGARTLIALDVSGSMAGPQIAGMPGITPRLGSAAMALVTLATEANTHVVAFSSGGMSFGKGRFGWDQGIRPLDLSARMSLKTVLSKVSNLPFGGTDCALPMKYALANKLMVDTFVIYTDSETWFGDEHPVQALRRYRRALNPDAKLIVVGMVSNRFTIADPSDAGMLDVVGFDAAAPRLMSEFSAGRL